MSTHDSPKAYVTADGRTLHLTDSEVEELRRVNRAARDSTLEAHILALKTEIAALRAGSIVGRCPSCGK